MNKPIVSKLVISKRETKAYEPLPWWVERVEMEDDMPVLFLESLAAFRTLEQAQAWLKKQHD